MRKIEITITPEYEILKLHKDGNPNTDWSVSVKTYTDLIQARSELDRLMNTGMYKAAILRNIPLQSRDELIQRMNDLLQKEV